MSRHIEQWVSRPRRGMIGVRARADVELPDRSSICALGEVEKASPVTACVAFPMTC